MRKVLILLGVVVALLLGALFVLPTLIPSDVYRTRIQEQLSSELGRDVAITGDVSLSTFPGIRARTGAVRVGSDDGMADLASLQALEARIKLLPLLARRVEIKSFTLVEPVITLERLEDGRTNWAIEEDAAEADATEAGPFRRDGRYTDFDPDITAFNIEDGTLHYIDRITDRDVTVSRIDTFLSLPGLGATLIVDGRMVVDGLPLTVDIAMDSPRAFLSGEAATLRGELATETAAIAVDGTVPPGADIAFAGSVDGEIADAAALRDALGSLLPDHPALALLRSGTFGGQLDYRGPDAVSLENADIDLSTTAGALRFAGSAAYAGQPVIDGQLEADVTDAQALRPLLPESVPGFERLRTVTLSAELESPDGKTVAIASADLQAAGQGFAATLSGSGRYDGALRFQGPFTASTPDAGALLRGLELDTDPAVLADAAVAGAVKASGTLDLDGARVTATGLDVTSESDVQSARYTGTVAYDGVAILDGRVEATVPSVPALAARLSTEIPTAAAVGRVAVKAELKGPQDALALSGIDATLSDGAFNATYQGRAALGETPTLDGRFTAAIPDLGRLSEAVGRNIPYQEAIGRLEASGTASGSLDQLALRELDASMSEGLLNGSYAGSATLSGATVGLEGQLDVRGDSLRRLAALNGTELPASTESGNIFEGFGLSGRVGGTADDLRLSDATVQVDELRGNGQFALGMAGARPMLTGNLDMGALDLRPYMDAYSAQNPTGEIQPWSQEPLPVEGLRAVDAELDLSAQSVTLSRLSLGPTTMDVTLKDGRLSGDLPALALYGGKGRASFALDASKAVPTVALKASLDTLDNQGFLSAVAGFAKATGTAGTSIDITGAGRSQAEIMQSLSGAGDFKVLDGIISGIDAGEFLTGLDTALRSRALPGGFGPGKATRFRDLLGAFEIRDGVATIDRFSLDALGVSAEGSGRIDLGGQSLDFRFRPKATGEQARGLAAFGVPIRFAGSFGAARPSLDVEFLGEIAAAKAKAEAAKAVTDRVGGPVGDILGGVLGGGSKPATTTPDPSADTNAPTTPSPAPGSSPSVGGVIGGLLGGGSTRDAAPEAPQDSAPAEPAPETEESESVEDAVLGIFGIKRPKSEKTDAETGD